MWREAAGLLMLGGCSVRLQEAPAGCRAETSGVPAADRAAYREGMRDPAPCGRIHDPALRSECQAFGAAAIAPDDPEGAEVTCALILDPLWSQECWFLVADARELVGAEAREICGRAGRHQRQCAGHATAREGQRIVESFEEAEVVAAHAAVFEAMSAWMPPLQAEARADQLVAQRLARRDHDVPFHRALCGDAPDRLCARAYEARLDFALQTLEDGALARACAAGADLAAAEAAGLPPWAPGAEELVAGVYAARCSR